jgi:hypothetical protein
MINNMALHKLIILTLFFIASIPNVNADQPCSTFFIKITYYTNSGKQDSGYILYDHFQDGSMFFNPITEYDTIFHRILPNQTNYKKLKGINSNQYHRILAINKSILLDTNITAGNGNGYNEQKIIPVANTIYQFNYSDTIHYTRYTINSNYENESSLSLDSSINKNIDYLDTIHYAKAKYINFDTINLIVLDSILWCNDFEQIQWLDKNQIAQIRSKKITSYFRVSGNNEGFWIDFFSYDPKWTKYRILSILNLDKINKSLDNGGKDVFNTFSPVLQKAIRSNKILYFVRWNP